MEWENRGLTTEKVIDFKLVVTDGLDKNIATFDK